METNQVNYILILKDSLKKKVRILDDIYSICVRQSDLMKDKEIDFEAFDDTIDEKEKLLKEMQIMDNGFQSVYDRVKELLLKDKSRFKSDIEEMQSLIRRITDKSMDIQTAEMRNKEAFQEKVILQRKEKKMSRAANQVAANYYHNMNKLGAMDAQFLDTKK